MKKLPVHESKNILKFDAIPWAGKKLNRLECSGLDNRPLI